MLEEPPTVTQSPSTERKMLVKTGLLVVSNPKQIGRILPAVKKRIDNTLYIQLLSALTDPFGCFHTNVFNAWPKYSNTIKGIYTQAVNHCGDLDVKVLLSGLKYKNPYIQTKRPIDLIIFDREHSRGEIDNFIKNRVKNVSEGFEVVTTDCGSFETITDEATNPTLYKHSVLGGTFDRLHVAHKLLLTEAALRATEKITIGVTDKTMIESKTLWELIEPIDKRISVVKDFLEDVDLELPHHIVPIADLYGPTASDPTMDVIIVSTETIRGAEKINKARKNNGLKPLDIATIELIDEPSPSPNEELKISSSTCRMRALGNLLKPVQKKAIPDKPYVIGLTGGIGSGKSNVANRLSELGAHVINCDKLAHRLYQPGQKAYQSIVEEFGAKILSETGEINRRVLGDIVFKDQKQLQKLNSLLWPIMLEEIRNEVKQCQKKIVVVEAAILLGASWDKYCHEVWTTIVPPNEAIKRLQIRNGLTEKEAQVRIDSQLTNKKYVEAANVVISSLWHIEYTRKQTDKAWELLQRRIPS